MAKIGVVHYNWRGYDLESFAVRASEIGYRHCELLIGDIWPDESVDGEPTALAVRELLDKYGIEVSALAAGNDFICADRVELDAQIERYRKVCELARHVGTDVIRSDGGHDRDGKVPQDQWEGMMGEAFKRCAEFLESCGVRIALDNHGISTNDGELQVRLIEKVGSDRMGVNLDTMNYRWFGHDLDRCDHFFAIVAPHAFHTHLKDGTGSRQDYKGAALGEGEVNLAHAVRCLKEAGYDGVWAVEYEGTEAKNALGFEKCFGWMQKNV